jgi:hypothetical protein
MKSVDNPYNPGSGKPPAELAGRASIIALARSELERAKAGKPTRDLILLGLRGVGKTVFSWNSKPASFSFQDFVTVGLPLLLLTMFVTVALIAAIYPLQP